MRRKLFLSYSLLPLLMLPFLLAGPLSPSDLTKESFQTAKGENFSIEYPKGWKSQRQTTPDVPIVTLRLVNPEESTLLMVSLIPAKPNAALDRVEDLEKILINGTKPMLKNAVEKQVNSQSFRSDHCIGVYATLTDARFVEKPPSLGEYRYSATFILSYPGYLVTATFLTQEDIAQSVDLAVLLLKTLRKG